MPAFICIEELPANTPCVCDNCEALWVAGALKPLGEAVLTPGDQCPAGRCPNCGGLAYPNRLKDRAASYGLELYDSLNAIISSGIVRNRIPRKDVSIWSGVESLLKQVRGETKS